MSPISNFVEAFHFLTAAIVDAPARRLVLLSSLGEGGAFQYLMSRDFRTLGVVHLLVLSGSQVQELASASRRMLLCFLPRHWGEELKSLLCCLFLVGGLVTFASAAFWPPPLTRAAFVLLVRWAFPRWSEVLVWVGALGLQVAIFPQHLGALGFYLSWGASLTLAVARVFRWGFVLRATVVTVLCECLAVTLLGTNFPTWRQSLLAVLSNIGIGWLFEALLMPLSGWALAGSWAMALAELLGLRSGSAVLRGVRSCWAPLAEGSALLVLVAVRAFRYIGL
ncbi:MAG: ComEC/Rec2 family competence protein [Bdellovibrionales bacterium]|nr:ComEC/Rec2 family competence protein [Bdellovibrionales bacterium]